MVALIIQARMGSSRLPGKVLRPIAGRPMLSYQIERLRRCRRVDCMVVAAPTGAADDSIAAFCEREGLPCTRGPEHDVLRRYAEAARALGARRVVRVTSDCPLLDPHLVDDAIEALGVGDGSDYVSNMVRPTWPYGMAVEVFTREALEAADAEAVDPAEREHVTPFIYWRPQRFRVRSLTMDRDLSAHRWTVDTPEDFELVSRILADLYPRHPEFEMHDVLELLDAHPDWVAINRMVSQKTIAHPGVENA